MAFFLTTLSILLCYFSPDEIIPSLAPYRPQLMLLIPAVLVSVSTMSLRKWKLQMPQQLLLLGFWGGVFVSFFSKLRPMAALNSAASVSLAVGIYFLVYMNGFKLSRLRMLAALMILCGVILGAEGIWAYHWGGDIERPNIMIMRDAFGMNLDKRIRAYGILGDPNDFAQFLVVCIGLLLLFWRGSPIAKLVVIVTTAFLSYSIYLTFSRGAIFGLLAIAFVVASRKVGKVASLGFVGIVFVVMLALQFGGPRSLSITEGSATGRLLAWGVGIAELRSSPLFGVGYGQFTRVYGTQTAHNSWVLCFAELGLFGYFFWMALLVTTCAGLERLAKYKPETEHERILVSHVNAIRAALYGFLSTAWFLSRTYTQTLYILLAFGAVLIHMAQVQMPHVRTKSPYWVPLTIALEFASIVLVYLTIRVRAL
jgi:putative inorganic carbon (HCO3(-)) transporter